MLAEVLGSSVFAAVTTVGRRPATLPPAVVVASDKLAQHVVDVATPDSYRQYLPGHSDAICTLGVGDPAKLPREEVWRIEVDYVVAFASACREAGVERFSLMTSVGSDASSRSYFLKMKGTLEGAGQGARFPAPPHLSPFDDPDAREPLRPIASRHAGGLAKAQLGAARPLRATRGIRVEDLGRAGGLDAARGGRDDGTKSTPGTTSRPSSRAG